MKIFSGKGLDSRLVYDRVVRITDSLSDTLSCCEYVEVSLFSIVGGLEEAALDSIVNDSVYVIYYPTINLLPLRAKNVVVWVVSVVWFLYIWKQESKRNSSIPKSSWWVIWRYSKICMHAVNRLRILPLQGYIVRWADQCVVQKIR